MVCFDEAARVVGVAVEGVEVSAKAFYRLEFLTCSVIQDVRLANMADVELRT